VAVGVGSGDVAQPLRVALAASHQVVGRGGGRRHDHGGLVGGVRQQLARLVGGIGAQPFGLGEGALQPAGRLLQGVRPPAYGLLLEPAGLGVPAGHVVVQPLRLGAQLGGRGLLGGDLPLGLRAEPVGLGLGGVEQPPARSASGSSTSDESCSMATHRVRTRPHLSDPARRAWPGLTWEPGAEPSDVPEPVDRRLVPGPQLRVAHPETLLGARQSTPTLPWCRLRCTS
jgi:hypothetical protein